jgi:predicted Zn-dependent peptidase
MLEYQIHTFPNGIRVVHKEVAHTKIVHCGIMLDMGSRDEKPHQQGLAHFWEHMAFKGTKKHKSFYILNRLEAVGGELNAYTTKEKVCFHASVLDLHFEKAVELVADITFNSIFPESQLEKERGVILEEMSMYYDSLEDAIQDDFDAIVFQNHQLGANILGTQESVKSFQRADLQEFINENLDTHRIVFSSIGNMKFEEVVSTVSKYLEAIPEKISENIRQAPPVNQTQVLEIKRASTQAHCVMGRQAYTMHDERRLPFFMLTNLLGGQGMNSRFNLSLREKHGLVYGIDASYNTFVDTGFFGIYYATDAKQLKKANDLIWKEMQILVNQPLTKTQLQAVRNQMMGQLAMAEESNMSFMLMMAKSLLDSNRIESLIEIFDAIKAVSVEQIQDIAKVMFNPSEMSQLTFVPKGKG